MIRADSSPPTVSIVLTAYNRAEWLDLSISSCLGQSFRDLELIVVDDASTDPTPDVIDAWRRRDERVVAARHARNRGHTEGQAAGLNTGLAMSRGELLTWTSDDNMYRPDAIARLVAELRARPDIDLVYAGHHAIDECGAELEYVAPSPVDRLVVRNIVQACFMYRRRVHETVGPYATDLPLALDYDYWLRVLARFMLAPLDADLFLFRRHPGALSEQSHSAQDDQALEAILRNLPRLAQRKPELAAAGHFALAERFLHSERFADARRHWLAAARLRPALIARNRALCVQSVIGPNVTRALRRLLGRTGPRCRR